MEELQERYGTSVIVDLVKGNRGVFDVHVDGQLVFSKHALHRFPDRGELAELASAAAASP